MACELFAVSFDAIDPPGLARFWSGVLGWEVTEDPGDGVTLRPADDNGFRLKFRPSAEPDADPNRMHFDLTSGSLEDQQQTVTRSLHLGARHIDVGQRLGDGHVVLADPAGYEFCVIEPGNKFLAGCGVIGAVNCDGSAEVGYFWSRALEWPLVWDQDEETAIQSPHGGSKITWSGPPLLPKTAKNHQHFELRTPTGGNHQAEIDRLLSLGATRIDGERLADPDGNEFTVPPPQ
jgi:catechol 2,3-dioxygenase-like lactoylglutathione lyase family enzyme